MHALVHDLLGHAEWANAEFVRAWAASPARDHEELRRRVSHICDVPDNFLLILTGRPPVGPAPEPPAGFDALVPRLRASYEALTAFAAGLSADDWSKPHHFTWFPDPPCVISTAEALTQLALHAQHHRGQLMTRLKDHGGTPVNMDYIIWLWQRRPAAGWA